MTKYILLALVMMAACASDDQSVLGTWSALPNAFFDDDGGVVVGGPDLYTFREDGTVVLGRSNSEDSLEGNYEIAGDRMSMSLSGEGWAFESEIGFVLTPERLLLGVLFPDGEVDGALGAWSAYDVINGEASHMSLVLEADGTVLAEADGETEDGTWREDGESLALQFDDYTEYWHRIGEHGIGDVALERTQ